MNCVIIHGGPLPHHSVEIPHHLDTQHWLPWLKQQLELNGIKTEIPAFPNPWSPNYFDHKAVLDSYLVDHNTVLVGHSRGAAFLLRWLSETKCSTRALFLIAPKLFNTSTDPNKVEFYNFEIDPCITSRIKEMMIFISKDDDVENIESAAAIQKITGCGVATLTKRGHFIEQDSKSNTTFPELLQKILMLY